MDNIILWVSTVSVYHLLLLLLASIKPQWVHPLDSRTYVRTNLGWHLKRVGLMALLCLPLNINENVFTVFGNAKSSKNIYSLASFYQKAEGHAVNIFGVGGVQHAKDFAITGVGVVLCQESTNDEAILPVGICLAQNGHKIAGILFGGSGIQESSRGLATTFLGINGLQVASNTEVVAGFSLFQDASKNALIGIGAVGYQGSKNSAVLVLGLAGRQRAGEHARALIGFVGCQTADKTAKLNCAMAIHQRVRDRSRSFGFFSDLE